MIPAGCGSAKLRAVARPNKRASALVCGFICLSGSLCVVSAFSSAWAAAPGAVPEPKFQERRQVARTLAVNPHDTVTLTNQFGNVQVSAVSASRVSVSAELTAGADSKACAESCLKHLAIKFEQHGRRVTIAAHAEPGYCAATQFQTDLIVSVPENAVLFVENAYGDVTVTGVQGMVTATNRFGNTNVHGGHGANVSNAFGDVNVEGLQSLVVKNRVGNVTAHDVTGPVQIVNETGTIRLMRTNGPVRLDNKLGEVAVAGCQGRIRITNSQGPITFQQVQASPDTVSIAGNQSAIRLKLPSAASARVNARVSQGCISCSESPAKQPVAADGYDQVASYQFGSCAALFDLESTGSGITIDRE